MPGASIDIIALSDVVAPAGHNNIVQLLPISNTYVHLTFNSEAPSWGSSLSNCGDKAIMLTMRIDNHSGCGNINNNYNKFLIKKYDDTFFICFFFIICFATRLTPRLLLNSFSSLILRKVSLANSFFSFLKTTFLAALCMALAI